MSSIYLNIGLNSNQDSLTIEEAIALIENKRDVIAKDLIDLKLLDDKSSEPKYTLSEIEGSLKNKMSNLMPDGEDGTGEYAGKKVYKLEVKKTATTTINNSKDFNSGYYPQDFVVKAFLTVDPDDELLDAGSCKVNIPFISGTPSTYTIKPTDHDLDYFSQVEVPLLYSFNLVASSSGTNLTITPNKGGYLLNKGYGEVDTTGITEIKGTEVSLDPGIYKVTQKIDIKDTSISDTTVGSIKHKNAQSGSSTLINVEYYNGDNQKITDSSKTYPVSINTLVALPTAGTNSSTASIIKEEDSYKLQLDNISEGWIRSGTIQSNVDYVPELLTGEADLDNQYKVFDTKDITKVINKIIAL